MTLRIGVQIAIQHLQNATFTLKLWRFLIIQFKTLTQYRCFIVVSRKFKHNPFVRIAIIDSNNTHIIIVKDDGMIVFTRFVLFLSSIMKNFENIEA